MSPQVATSCDMFLAVTPLQDMSIGSQGSRPAQSMTKELEGIISTDSWRKRYGHTALDPSSSMNGTCERRSKARSGHPVARSLWRVPRDDGGSVALFVQRAG